MHQDTKSARLIAVCKRTLTMTMVFRPLTGLKVPTNLQNVSSTFVIFGQSLEKNCNVSCQPKISSSYTFLMLKLREMTSTKVSVYMKTSSQIPGFTSFPSTLTAKKSMKMTFSDDKINYNFSQENPKITNV